ncbi:MAG: NlpC/P60 family protein [Oceanisphaera sp.]|uniref:C40 family peptidase n=1 Tax=Oceanisphaera sp. TaxID=1929979 RepID=UPI003F955EDB
MKKISVCISILLLAACSSSPKKKPTPPLVSTLTYTISTEPKPAFNHARSLRQAYQRWRGVPYRFGGSDDQGMDCSAFTQTLYQEVYDMSLPRSTHQQVEVGRLVPKAELQPGDVVFFRTGRNRRHNGVYVGEGKFAHASSSVGVTISRLDNIYWRSRFWQARRMLED